MAIKSREVTDKKEWEAFIATHAEANFLQSWLWGEFHQALNHKVLRTGFYNNEKLVGVMLMIIENAKRGRHGIVPAGPIIDWSNKALVAAAFNTMKELGKKEGCVFVRVRPQLIAHKAEAKQFKDFGFTSAPMHLHAELTWQLDLTQSEDEILANMRKKTRYEIRQADKQSITVSTTQEANAIDRFYEIQLETAQRQKFVPFSKKFLKEQFRVFAAENNAILFEGYKGDELLAQAFIIFYGKEAAYHYGTSTDANRNLAGAYALQWAAIKEAKKRGIERYNFWGVTKPEHTKHRFYGVSVFKRGFGGFEVEYLHAQDLVISKSKYFINAIIETIRKHFRKV